MSLFRCSHCGRETDYDRAAHKDLMSLWCAKCIRPMYEVETGRVVFLPEDLASAPAIIDTKFPNILSEEN